MWPSSRTDALLDKEGAATYERLDNMLFSHELEMLYDMLHSDKLVQGGHGQVEPDRHNPLYIAKVLSRFNIDLGIVCSDDPSTVFWPVGKSNAVKGRSILIYYWLHGDFSAIRVLSAGCSDAIRSTDCPGAGDINASIHDNTDPISCSSPFLRLPAELRNQIYEEYLIAGDVDARSEFYNDTNVQWGFILHEPGNTAERFALPELACTCRQIRDELLPQWVDRKTYLIEIKLE